MFDSALLQSDGLLSVIQSVLDDGADWSIECMSDGVYRVVIDGRCDVPPSVGMAVDLVDAFMEAVCVWEGM